MTADATRLKQVLLNLLSNAIKFNREFGEVQVRGLAVADGMRLEVADQGLGIAPEQLPRLFQAFERLDMAGAVEGTGIGLALSRSLVTLMHGEIGVRSVPGQGRVFWVRLSAAPMASLRPTCRRWCPRPLRRNAGTTCSRSLSGLGRRKREAAPARTVFAGFAGP